MKQHIKDAITKAKKRYVTTDEILARLDLAHAPRGWRGMARNVAPDGTMRCLTCQKPTPLNEFYLHVTRAGRKHHDSHCNGCRKARMIARRLGITVADYKAILAAFDGTCTICRLPVDKPNLDHCHTSGQVRGILCTRCNSGLGQFRDNPAILRAAADYLEGSLLAIARFSKSPLIPAHLLMTKR